MTRALITAAAVLVLSGCTDSRPKNEHVYEQDYSQRQKLFLECLHALPVGPSTTHYNDWSEVVESCQRSAQYNAYYCVANCPPPNPATLAKVQP